MQKWRFRENGETQTNSKFSSLPGLTRPLQGGGKYGQTADGGGDDSPCVFAHFFVKRGVGAGQAKKTEEPLQTEEDRFKQTDGKPGSGRGQQHGK